MMAIDSGAGIHVEVVAPPTPAVVVMFTWIVAHTSFMGTAVVTEEVESTYDATNNAGGHGREEGMRMAITILPQTGVEPPLRAMTIMAVPVAV